METTTATETKSPELTLRELHKLAIAIAGSMPGWNYVTWRGEDSSRFESALLTELETGARLHLSQHCQAGRSNKWRINVSDACPYNLPDGQRFYGLRGVEAKERTFATDRPATAIASALMRDDLIVDSRKLATEYARQASDAADLAKRHAATIATLTESGLISGEFYPDRDRPSKSHAYIGERYGRTVRVEGSACQLELGSLTVETAIAILRIAVANTTQED